MLVGCLTVWRMVYQQKQSGSMPVEPARLQRILGVMILIQLGQIPPDQILVRPQMLDLMTLMPGDFLICTEMFGSIVLIGTAPIQLGQSTTQPDQATDRHGLKEVVHSLRMDHLCDQLPVDRREKIIKMVGLDSVWPFTLRQSPITHRATSTSPALLHLMKIYRLA